MLVRVLQSTGDGPAVEVADVPAAAPAHGWVWVDLEVGPDDTDALVALTRPLRLDMLAVRDAIEDIDLPKVDDFDHHLLVILHGLRDDRVATYEVASFLTDSFLVTVRKERSPAVDALWSQVQRSAELASGDVGELVARLADVLTRRLLAVLDEFENSIDSLIFDALVALPSFLGELTAMRTDLAAVRRVVNPQREALDMLRRSTSPLLDHGARRRFSDVFDVALRVTHGLDAARTALAEALDAYRGAEAKKATEVTKVLTVYAAIMLPLSLVAGFFGMNFDNLPGLDHRHGWIWVTGAMLLVAVLSLGVFVAAGWIRRPSGRAAGITLGRGLIEAARAPAQVVGAVFEISTMPLRASTSRKPRSRHDGD